jgi:hypothetical protein
MKQQGGIADEPTVRVTRLVTAGYIGSVGLAAVLLVFVGDKVLAGFLVACEVSMVTGIHLVSRTPRTAPPPAPDPLTPILDRPGHEPVTRAGLLRMVGAFLGVMGVVLGIIAAALAFGH